MKKILAALIVSLVVSGFGCTKVEKRGVTFGGGSQMAEVLNINPNE